MCNARGVVAAQEIEVEQEVGVVLSQAVEDKKLPANPALRLGKYLRQGDTQPIDIQPLYEKLRESTIRVERMGLIKLR